MEDQQDTDIYLQKTWFIQSNNGQIEDAYDIDIKKKLGSGSYGCVYQAQQKESKIFRAIKMIPKNKVKNHEKFKLEIDIMRNLDHPNIIKLFETFQDSRNVYLVMELCEGGELFDRIIDKGQFSEAEAKIVFSQIMQSLYYCHSNGIAHRDLKPENFIYLTKAEDSPIKVIDFGLSKHFDDATTDFMTTRAGTPYYISPQVLAGQYDQSCDIWSAGVILYILLSGVPPFGGETDAEILSAVQKGVFDFNSISKFQKSNNKFNLLLYFLFLVDEFKTVSNSAQDLIMQMITSPQKRLQPADVLKHPWLQEDTKGKGIEVNYLKLQGFTQNNKLKKVALTFIASQLSESEISDLGKLFRSIDKNGDGTLSIEELKECLSNSSQESYEEILKVIKQIDTDGSGKISYNQFIAASIEKSLYMKEEKLLFAFRNLDINGDGQITKAELKQVLGSDPTFKNQKESYWDEMIKSADKNGDGQIDFNEFIDMMSTFATKQ